MDRLTYKDYEQILVKELDIVGIGEKNADILSRAIEKLSYYEDLEEQGRLIESPCKVGDTLYSIERRAICKNTSDYIYGNYQCLFCRQDHIAEFKFYINEIKATLPLIGNLINNINNNYESGNFHVYLTREEAEKKLEKMRCEDEQIN